VLAILTVEVVGLAAGVLGAVAGNVAAVFHPDRELPGLRVCGEEGDDDGGGGELHGDERWGDWKEECSRCCWLELVIN
jgi:hypothetical protein